MSDILTAVGLLVVIGWLPILCLSGLLIGLALAYVPYLQEIFGVLAKMCIYMIPISAILIPVVGFSGVLLFGILFVVFNGFAEYQPDGGEILSGLGRFKEAKK